MGNIFTCCPCRKSKIGSIREVTLLMIGLDNAGKTCTARHLLGEPSYDTVPTVGFTSIQIKHGRYTVCVYDIGGGPKIRGIWQNYYALVHGVIFVVDSSEPLRFEECKEEIEHVISDERIAGKPILLFFNKQDLESAVNETELVTQLELETLVNRHRCPTRVEGTCAIYKAKSSKDPGIVSGFNWLIGHINKDFKILKERVERERMEQMDRERRERAERMERVRRIREEREKAQSVVEQKLNSRPVDDDDDDVIIGTPFQPINKIKADLEQRAKKSNGPPSGVRVIHVSPSNSAGDKEVVLQPEEIQSPGPVHIHPSANGPIVHDGAEPSNKSRVLYSSVDCVDVRDRHHSRKPKKRFKNRVVPQAAKPPSLINPTSGDLPPLKSAVEVLNGNVAVYNSPKRVANGQTSWALQEF